MLEELSLSLPTGYRLDTSTRGTHVLHRADGLLVCEFLPELANKKIVRQLAARDNLLATGRGDLDYTR